MASFTHQRILIVGAGSGIGRALAASLLADGAEVVAAVRDPQKAPVPGTTPARVDLGDQRSIEAVAGLGPFDHVVSLGAAPANGPLADLTGSGIRTAFDAKVIGPLLLAKHLAPAMPAGGSFVFFAGVAAWAPAPARTVMATTNGAVAFLVEALAVEIAPRRAVAVSPGIIDSGSWDGLGEDAKSELFTAVAEKNPARRIGAVDDVVDAVRFAMGNGFVTGSTIHVDGGGKLV